MTHEKAQCEVLKLANERGKFALQIGSVFPEAVQFVFEQMQVTGWIRLLDVSPIAEYPDRLFRVFVASPIAMAWFHSQQEGGGHG